MPDIETLDVLTINCNTIDTQTQNGPIYNKIEDEWQCKIKRQESGKPEKCNANTTGIQIQVVNIMQHNATAIDNNNSKINYFTPVCQQEGVKGANAK